MRGHGTKREYDSGDHSRGFRKAARDQGNFNRKDSFRNAVRTNSHRARQNDALAIREQLEELGEVERFPVRRVRLFSEQEDPKHTPAVKTLLTSPTTGDVVAWASIFKLADGTPLYRVDAFPAVNHQPGCDKYLDDQEPCTCPSC